MTNFDMKEFLRRMMQGWLNHADSYDTDEGYYKESPEESMKKAFEGYSDHHAHIFADLFGYWSNDIQGEAANRYHIAIIEGKVVDIDPPPTDGEYYWYETKWIKVEPCEDIAESKVESDA